MRSWAERAVKRRRPGLGCLRFGKEVGRAGGERGNWAEAGFGLEGKEWPAGLDFLPLFFSISKQLKSI